MIASFRAPSVDLLIPDQLRAAASPQQSVFIEAEPGSGKTTVSALRFGVHRFNTQSDSRAVLATSFTRSATRELRHRIRRYWGSSALAFPHRVTTVDSILYELLRRLLATGALRWPGGQSDLVVQDSWASLVPTIYTTRRPTLRMLGGTISPGYVLEARKSNRPAPAAFWASVRAGSCTHDEVRAVVSGALASPGLRGVLLEFLAQNYRSVIVDEVFDANPLDIALIELALDAGVAITLVGDPWQALYAFRGARPQEVWKLVADRQLDVLPLRAAFRWQTPHQQSLAESLRRQEGVTLPEATDVSTLNAVLASEWKPLWNCGDAVLPLAFGSFSGTPVEAAATLLLDQMTRAAFRLDAVYVADALRALSIKGDAYRNQLEQGLQSVLAALLPSTKDAAEDAYARLEAWIAAIEGARALPPLHWRYRKRLELLQSRLAAGANLVPGLTAHQAKGREWDYVGLRLKDTEAGVIKQGLSRDQERDRRLYVACTRARHQTSMLKDA